MQEREFAAVVGALDCSRPAAVVQALTALRTRWLRRIDTGLAGGFLLGPAVLPCPVLPSGLFCTSPSAIWCLVP